MISLYEVNRERRKVKWGMPGQGVGRMGSRCLVGAGFWFGVKKGFWRWTVNNMSLVPLNPAIENGQNGEFYVGCVFTTVL